MGDSYDPLIWRPYGLNTEDNPRMIGLGKASASLNFLFQQKQALTRPGLKIQSVSTGLGGAIPQWGFGFVDGATVGNLMVTNDSKLWSLPDVQSGVPATNITGAAPTIPSFTGLFAAIVNSVILMSGVTNGMVRWNPTGTVATQLNGVNYRYVTSHLARAVAAYDPVVGGAAGPRTVAWSVPGDETTWTGTVNGSGLSVLADIPDVITGLCILNNVVVIARSYGFHIGQSTGLAFPAYSFQTFNRDGVGVFYPGSLATDSNIAYFLGEDNIYSFDLNTITPIGDELRSSIINAAQGGANFRGFVTRTNTNGYIAGINNLSPRPIYHLVPTNAVLSGSPHYTYDIREQTWSSHQYGAITSTQGFKAFDNGLGGEVGVGFFDTGAHVDTWNTSIACEQVATVSSGVLQYGKNDRDYTFQRTLLSLLGQGAAITVKVTINATQADSQVSANQSLLFGSAPDVGLWIRKYFDPGRLVGNNFQITVSTTATQPLVFDEVAAMFDPDEAVYRGF